ncbi:MAG: HAD family phosphatase [Thermodesulfobacteriota bacterium]|nr:HAD family phosphatase [Thermodesulfobacteriota bacterium]
MRVSARTSSLDGVHREYKSKMAFFNGYGVRGVIFDIDGTLLDSLSLYSSVMNRVLEGVDVSPLPKDALFKHLGIGMSLKNILRKTIFEDRGAHFIDEVAKEILDRFIEVDMEIQLFPGVRQVFDFVRSAEIKIGLATGRTSSSAHEWKRLKEKGLDRFVDTIVTAAEVQNRKPAPDVIVECAKNMDIPAKKCVVIGDSVSDILAARAAGAIPVGVCTGVTDKDTLNAQRPEAILEELADLIGLFDIRKI